MQLDDLWEKALIFSIWTAEACLETRVAEHMPLLLLQNYWARVLFTWALCSQE